MVQCLRTVDAGYQLELALQELVIDDKLKESQIFYKIMQEHNLLIPERLD